MHWPEFWVAVNDQSYEKEVLRFKGFVVVDFWHPRCEECIEIAPMLVKISEECAGRVKFCHFRCPTRLAFKLKLGKIPAVYFYKDGELVGRLLQEQISEGRIREKLREFGLLIN
ncbi:MAG: thioredoxin family protein [Candidatus Bathyarchaeia archaeon]